MDKQTAIYCRVSTEQQSTDRQKDELLKYAAEKGLSVADDRIYIDYTSGFKKGEFRPAYSKMKSEVEKGNIDIILFSEFTRMSRSANDLLQEIAYYREHSVSTYFLKQDIWIKTVDKIKSIYDKMASDIILHMLAVNAQYEIELFDERTLSGKISKITKKKNGGGLERAYGYMHNENKEIIVNEEERQIVVRIFQMYADGYSSIQICDVLNSEGVPPPYANRIKVFKENRKKKKLEPKTYEHFNVEGLRWRPSSLNRILHNELYIGIKSITMFKPDPTNTTPRHKRKDRGTPILDYHEEDEELRIIDDILFQRVQDRLAKAPYNKNNAIKHDNLLKAKLKCGECGSNFTVGKQNDTTVNYRCDPRSYKCYGRVNRKDKPKTCSTGAEIRQCKLDGLVLTLSLRMFAEINITENNEKQIKRLSKEIATAKQVRDDKKKQLEELKEEHKTVLQRLSRVKGKSEKIVTELMIEAQDKFKKDFSEKTASITKLDKEISKNANNINRLKKLAQKYTDLHNKMDEIWHSKELVKYMIDEYIEKVIIYKIHPMWNLVVVKYVNDCEFWGTIKSKRYKNSETFFDERFCRHGLEFQAWILDNSTHCFSYDSAGHTISYNGTHEVYSRIPKGTYTFIEFDKILHDTEWIGSFPLYDFENQKPLPQEPPLDYEKRVSVIPTEVS